MNCPNCGGALTIHPHKAHLACAYCGALHFPEPNQDGVQVLDAASEIDCPLCRAPLTHAAICGARVLYCETCRGLLIDTECFVNVVDYLRAVHDPLPGKPQPFDRKELTRILPCPKCHARMDTHPYGGPGNIVIDNCRECRVNWLDYRELRRVTRGFDIY